MDKNDNREGSTRQLKNGSWECITQAKYLNPKTANPKRFKRTAKTEKEARRLSIMARDAWEKEYERGKDIKVDKKKTFGEYMDEYIETEVKPTVAGSTYHSYVNTMRANFDNFPIAKYQLHMLSAVEFESYYDTILGLKSRKTCSFPIQLTRRCCKWLVNRSLLKENYAEQARVKKEIIDEYDKKLDEEVKNRKEVFTPEDIEKFYYAFEVVFELSNTIELPRPSTSFVISFNVCVVFLLSPIDITFSNLSPCFFDNFPDLINALPTSLILSPAVSIAFAHVIFPDLNLSVISASEAIANTSYFKESVSPIAFALASI